MIEEIIKALGPWPMLQFLFIGTVFAVGIYAIWRGMNKKDQVQVSQLEDKRSEWEAYKQLENIEENSFKMVELMSKIIDGQLALRDSINGLSAALWNRKQG